MIRRLLDNLPEAAILALLGFAFLLGGSARPDMLSVILLRPIGVLLLALAIAWTPREVWRGNRVLIGIALAWIALALVQLVPLPQAVWQALPGRELAIEIDAAVGLDVWRPLSLVPWRTFNALLALCLPLAVLLLTLQVRRDRQHRVVYLLFALVIVSAVLGLLQVIGGPNNGFYTYRVTNPDSAVGLLANRNHNAIFLSLGLPLLAASLALWPTASELVRLRNAAGAGAGLLLIPFILTTQSRAGILVALLCAGLALWVFRAPAAVSQKRRPRTQINPRLIFGGFAAVGVVLLTVVFTATNAVERLSRLGREDDELRLTIWPNVARLIGDYFPIGSGFGTFDEIYRTAEPAETLSPKYINHAHNDWLEVLMTGGLPAALILLAAVVFFATRSLQVLRTERDPRAIVLHRLGISICFVLALASLYDYPLRTPALAALFAAGMALACGSWRKDRRAGTGG